MSVLCLPGTPRNVSHVWHTALGVRGGSVWLLFTDKETPFQLSHAHMATQQGEGRTLALFPSGNTPEATLEHNYLAFFQAYSDASIRGQFTFLPLPLLSIPSSFLSFLAGESLIYSCISLGIPVTLIHLPPSQLTWKYHQSALGVYRKDGAGSLCTLACKECAEKTTCGECDSNSSSPHLHPELKTVCCAPGSSWVNV